jgi:hypothetical protein
MNQHGEIILYQTEDGMTKIDVRFEDEMVWLTQQQMAELFQSSRSNIVGHIQHIYEEGELDEASTRRKFRQVRTEGKLEKNQVIRKLRTTAADSKNYNIAYYNLNMMKDTAHVL